MSFSLYSVCPLIQLQIKSCITQSSFLQSHISNIQKSIHCLKRGTHTQHQSVGLEKEGYDTGIKLYNSSSRSKVLFKTINPGLVTWYNCGPTVYDSAHIGHALCFVRLDIIKRILQDIFHLDVVQVTGITDVDDKIIARTKELNTCVQTLTQKYEKEFFKDMAKLNVLPPSIAPRVTEHIPQILSFVAKIMEKGLAYDVGQGTVYFDTESYGRYGKLVKQNEKEIIQIFSDSRKKSIRDFVLWKGAAKDDCIAWDSPWGPGRPGWHIECSAMASEFFGEELDLHSGGIDLLFPHHENEEAQCCAHHTRDQWCNYWIHTGHLHIKGNTKMSKSLYNTISIEKFLEEHSANSFRLYCLFSHYRNYVEYTPKSMDYPNYTLEKIRSFFQDSKSYVDGSNFTGPLDEALILSKLCEVRSSIRSSLADDFNTRNAMFSIIDLISLCNKELSKSRKSARVGRSIGTMVAVRQYLQKLLTTLGMTFKHELPAEDHLLVEDESVASIVDSALSFRQSVKNFALQKHLPNDKSLSKAEMKKLRQDCLPLLKSCDKMRDVFNASGIEITDYSEASSWTFRKGKKADAPEDETKRLRKKG